MEKTVLSELEKMACQVRLSVIEGTFNAGCGHPGDRKSVV